MVEKHFTTERATEHRTGHSRRTFLKGVGQFTITAALHTDGFGLLDRSQRAYAESESPSLSDNQTPYQETGREIIDETTEHLHDLYKEYMTEDEGYENEDYQKRFCQEIALVADRLNPENHNLGNQIAAQMLVEISFKTFPDPSKNTTTKMSPLEQISFVEDYLRNTEPDGGYWNLTDLYKDQHNNDPDAIIPAMEHAIRVATETGEDPNFLADPRTQREGDAIDELGETKEEQLATLVEMSRNTYPDHEPLARLMATQLILESGLEDPSDLFNLYNNPFGMKGIGTHGAVYLPTIEQDDQGNEEETWDWFQAHATLQDGFNAHRELMEWDNYDRVWEATTFEEAADYIVNPGKGKSPYATDKEYTEKLIDTYNTHLKNHFEPNTTNESESVPESEMFLQSAEDIKEAYEYANNGYTTDFPGLAEILREFLAERGYSEQQLDAFEERRKKSLVNSGDYGMATQCLGWVGTVTALWTGTSNPETTLNTFAHAREVNMIYGNGTPLPIGDFTFQAIGSGIDADILPGDIASSAEHIGIVYEIAPENPAAMTLIESNGYVDCRVTSDREDSKAEYTFYRLIGEQLTTKTENNASPGEAPSISHTAPHLAAIEAGFGMPVPEYFETSEEYEQAIKSEFGVIMNGFSKTHLEWAWEKLWSNKNTNFSELAKDSIYVAKENGETTSHQEQCQMNGLPDIYLVEYSDKAQFQRVFSHEAGHFDHCRDWIENAGEKLARMQEIIDQEGPVSDYGATGVTENYADMIMYTLDPSDGYVSIGEGTPPNPIYSGEKPLHTAFAKEILFS